MHLPVTHNNTSAVRKLIAAIAFIFILADVTAQIGIGINPPDSSAILHLQDTARGLLIPRMTEAQRNAIRQPATGLMVYQTDDPAGFFYYNGNAWINMAQDNMGAHMVVLADDITNQEAQEKIAAEVGPFTREIKIVGCTNLTTVNLPKLTEAVNIVIYNNPVLQSVYLNNLASVMGGEIGIAITKNPSLTTLNLSSLKRVILHSSIINNGMVIADSKLASLSLPNLQKVTSLVLTDNKLLINLSLPALHTATAGLYFTYNTALANLTIPNLRVIGFLGISYNGCQSVSFPSLVSTNSTYIEYNNSLSSVSLPVLVNPGNILYPNNSTFSIKSNPNLTTIELGQFSNAYCRDYHFSYNRLNSNTINGILHNFVSINPPISGKDVFLYAQVPPAPPTGQGISDYNILTGNGNNILTD